MTHTHSIKKCSMNTRIPLQTLRNHFPVIFTLFKKRPQGKKQIPVIFDLIGGKASRKKKVGYHFRRNSIVFMVHEYLRVTGVHDAVLGCAGLFVLALRGGGVQEFDTRWDEILLQTNNVPTDDVLKNLYNLRGRESGQLKNHVGNV